MAVDNGVEPRADFAGIQALSSRGAGYAVAEKCLQVQADAEALDPSLRTADGVRLHDDAWSWYVGALGEIEVGKMLKALGPEWFVRHAIPIGAGTKDVDHLVIGPGGVFAINTKHHDGASVWLGDHIVRINNVNQHHVKQAQKDGLEVRRRLSGKVGFSVTVTPMVALLNARSITDSRAADNRQVEVLDANRLVAWLSAQDRLLGTAELDLIKLAAEEPETWHVDPRAADILRVMQRFERLVSNVGPLPVRTTTPSPVRTRPARGMRRTPTSTRPGQRKRQARATGRGRVTVGDLLKLWFGFGFPVVLILIFRDAANQPCTSPVGCLLPTFYAGLRPLLMLAVPVLLGMGALGSLLWLLRKLRR
jgi:hypothetical protein